MELDDQESLLFEALTRASLHPDFVGHHLSINDIAILAREFRMKLITNGYTFHKTAMSKRNEI